MTPEEIKQKLKEKKLSQLALARRWQVQACTVHALIHSRLTSKRLEKNLARTLGVTVEQLKGLAQEDAVR